MKIKKGTYWPIKLFQVTLQVILGCILIMKGDAYIGWILLVLGGLLAFVTFMEVVASRNHDSIIEPNSEGGETEAEGMYDFKPGQKMNCQFVEEVIVCNREKCDACPIDEICVCGERRGVHSGVAWLGVARISGGGSCPKFRTTTGESPRKVYR